jgi:hypothetical protein
MKRPQGGRRCAKPSGRQRSGDAAEGRGKERRDAAEGRGKERRDAAEGRGKGTASPEGQGTEHRVPGRAGPE